MPLLLVNSFDSAEVATFIFSERLRAIVDAIDVKWLDLYHAGWRGLDFFSLSLFSLSLTHIHFEGPLFKTMLSSFSFHALFLLNIFNNQKGVQGNQKQVNQEMNLFIQKMVVCSLRIACVWNVIWFKLYFFSSQERYPGIIGCKEVVKTGVTAWSCPNSRLYIPLLWVGDLPDLARCDMRQKRGLFSLP